MIILTIIECFLKMAHCVAFTKLPTTKEWCVLAPWSLTGQSIKLGSSVFLKGAPQVAKDIGEYLFWLPPRVQSQTAR